MKRIIPNAETALRAVSYASCIVGGWLVILLSFAIFVEVLLRKVFNKSLQGVDEYGGYALATTAALGLAYCFYEHAHIRIDLVVRVLPKMLGRVLAIFAIAVFGVVVGILALEAVRLTQESYMFGAFSNTPLRTPLYYPQAIWATGLCLFFVVIVLRLLHLLQAAVQRDTDAIRDMLGETVSDDSYETTRMQGIE